MRKNDIKGLVALFKLAVIIGIVAVVWSQWGGQGVFWGIVLLLVLGSLFGEGTKRCSWCGTQIKRVSYRGKLEGEKVILCPNCARRAENEISRRAANAKIAEWRERD